MPHIHELIDLTVSAYIFFEDKVLLMHHKKLNTWLQPGGHVELDQDTDEALFAEVKEETGLDIEVLAERAPTTPTEHEKPLLRPTFVDIHWINDVHRHLNLSYICRAETDEIQLAEAEANDLRWFTREEVGGLNDDEIFQNVREFIEASFDEYARLTA